MTHLARVKVKTVAGGLLPAVKAAGHDILQAGGGEGLVSGQGGEVGGPGGGQHRLVLGLLVSPDLYFSKQLTSLTRHHKYGCGDKHNNVGQTHGEVGLDRQETVSVRLS